MVRIMDLRPSDIHFSQDSILNTFGDYSPHSGVFLGQTLDDLLQGYCNVNSIPRISVTNIEGEWFTADNRRLWVFRKAEKLGFLDTIEVQLCNYIPEHKLTTENGGTDIRVRGRPGGTIWRRWRPPRTSHNNQITRINRHYNQNNIHNEYTSRNPTPNERIYNAGSSHDDRMAHHVKSVTQPTTQTNLPNLSNRSHSYIVDYQTLGRSVSDGQTSRHPHADDKKPCDSNNCCCTIL